MSNRPQQQQLLAGAGCVQIIGKKSITLPNGKKEQATIFCGKTTDGDQALCPKHLAIKSYDPEKRRLAALKGIALKEHRKALVEALETSLLRAENHDYIDPKQKKQKAAYVDASV